MTTPRTAEDYAEAKRKFYEDQLSKGKGRPEARPGPVYDMPAEPTWNWLGRFIGNCCSYYLAAFVCIFLSSIFFLAAGNASLARDATQMPAASTPQSFNPLEPGAGSPASPFTSALQQAVHTVNVAVNRAAASVDACTFTESAESGVSQTALLSFMADYIADVNSRVDAAAVAALLYEAAQAHGIDPLLFMCVARYESTFDVGDVGAAGERGLLQVHPCHRRSMARMGLDFASEADRLHYACHLYEQRGLRPWAVRRRALKLYEKLQGEM